ncbi:MAG: DUF1573 domain-containing protein [Planctomycetota bacterium]|jgi:hypothetical protein
MANPARRKKLLVLASAVLLVGACGVIVALAVVLKPLAGESRHDFGVVPISGDRAAVEHTFRLTNRTGHTLAISNVRPSCGCTSVETSARSVEPDGTLEVATTLVLTRSGFQHAYVYLDLGEAGMQTLTVQAIGRLTQRLTATRNRLKLASGRPAPLVLLLEVHESNDPPPPPTITAPEGVRATFDAWQQVRQRDKRKAIPARWAGRVLVEYVGESLPDDAALVIRADSDQTLTIPVQD